MRILENITLFLVEGIKKVRDYLSEIFNFRKTKRETRKIKYLDESLKYLDELYSTIIIL